VRREISKSGKRRLVTLSNQVMSWLTLKPIKQSLPLNCKKRVSLLLFCTLMVPKMLSLAKWSQSSSRNSPILLHLRITLLPQQKLPQPHPPSLLNSKPRLLAHQPHLSKPLTIKLVREFSQVLLLSAWLKRKVLT